MRLLGLILPLGALLSPAAADTLPDVLGSYTTKMQGIDARLHLVPLKNGTIAGLVDVPQQGATGIPCPLVKIKDRSLTVSCPSIGAEWKGEAVLDKQTLTGVWTQGARIQTVWTRTGMPKHSSLDMASEWQGMLGTMARPLRIKLKIGDAGSKCELDSLDEGKLDQLCTLAKGTGSTTELKLLVPAIDGQWEGYLTSDGNFLLGNWAQKSSSESIPLFFVRMR